MFSATTKEDAIGVKNTAQNLKDRATETVYDAKDDLRDQANKAGRKVRQYIDQATDELTNASDAVTTQIRENPLQSSLIALGVGFVLGALLRR